jgi:hypothetical protein
MVMLPSILIAQDLSSELEALKASSQGGRQTNDSIRSGFEEIGKIDLSDLAETLRRDEQQRTEETQSARLSALKEKCSDTQNEQPKPTLSETGYFGLFAGSCDRQCRQRVRERDRAEKKAAYETALARWQQAGRLRNRQRLYCARVADDLAAGVLPTEDVPAWSNADEARFERLAAGIQTNFENDQRLADEAYQRQRVAAKAQKAELAEAKPDNGSSSSKEQSAQESFQRTTYFYVTCHGVKSLKSEVNLRNYVYYSAVITYAHRPDEEYMPSSLSKSEVRNFEERTDARYGPGGITPQHASPLKCYGAGRLITTRKSVADGRDLKQEALAHRDVAAAEARKHRNRVTIE